jgi:Spy/CpxP family protein refolding chaperone
MELAYSYPSILFKNVKQKNRKRRKKNISIGKKFFYGTFHKNPGSNKKKENNFMKKIVFIALSVMILSLAVLPLSAQKGGKGEGHGKYGHGMGNPVMHFNMMQEKLGLTDAQVDKIYKIHKDYMDKFYQNRKDESKIKELHAKLIGEFQNVLTPEQKAKWEEMKKNRHKDDNNKSNKK